MGLPSFLVKAALALNPYINLYNYRTGALQQVPLTVGQPATYPDQKINSYIKAYSDNASVFTIVSTIASKFGYIPRYVYKIEDKESSIEYQKYISRKAIDTMRAKKLFKKAYSKNNKVKKTIKSVGEQEVDNPLSDLLNNPNNQYGQDSFFELTDIYYELTGEAFIWLDRGTQFKVDNSGELTETDSVIGPARLRLPIERMWVLPSQFMAITVDRSTYMGEILNYIFIRNGEQLYIPKEDIIHWKTPNPNYDAFNFTHLRGLSPLSAGRKLYTGDDAAMDAMVAMQQNDGAKGVLSNETFDRLTPIQKSAAEGAIDNKVNNRALKGAVAMLPGKWTYSYMGQNAVDMDLLASQDKMFARICNLYRLNPNFFLSGQTFDNLSQARKDFITQTILPRACSNRDELNRMLLKAFNLDEKQYTIDIDISELPEMQEDMQKQVQALSLAWWFSANQRLEMMGEEASPDPNMDKIWIPNNLTLMDDAAIPTPTLDGYTGNEVQDPGNGLSGGTVDQAKHPGGNGGKD